MLSNDGRKIFCKNDLGGPHTLREAVATFYRKLHDLAQCQLTKKADPTPWAMTAEDLIHEAYLRMSQKPMQFKDSDSFFAFVAKMMWHILLERRRADYALKRGGQQSEAMFDESFHVVPGSDQTLHPAVLNALRGLGRAHPRAQQIVVLKFFGGHTRQEIGKLLDLSEATVAREWNRARLWLSRYLS